MTLHRWLAALFVILALAGCAQTATGQGQTPATSYPSDNAPDRRGDMMLPDGSNGPRRIAAILLAGSAAFALVFWVTVWGTLALDYVGSG